MDMTLIDELFIESFGFVRGTKGERCYQICTGGGYVFCVFKGDEMACNLAVPSMTRSQFVYFVQALGVASPWIPVSRQQPGDMVTVLIAVPEERGYPDDRGRVGMGCFNHEFKCWHEACIEIGSGLETYEDCEVKPTHWMPLPDLGELFKERQLRKANNRKVINDARRG